MAATATFLLWFWSLKFVLCLLQLLPIPWNLTKSRNVLHTITAVTSNFEYFVVEVGTKFLMLLTIISVSSLWTQSRSLTSYKNSLSHSKLKRKRIFWKWFSLQRIPTSTSCSVSWCPIRCPWEWASVSGSAQSTWRFVALDTFSLWLRCYRFICVLLCVCHCASTR